MLLNSKHFPSIYLDRYVVLAYVNEWALKMHMGAHVIL